MPQNTLFSVVLLLIAILSSGIYFTGLKPVNARCRSLTELELFNGLFSATAMVGAMVSALVSSGSLYIPFDGLLTAALFGCGFSLCVFFNLKALEEGPLSLTTLIINFSLVFPLFYSFFFLGEAVTVIRVSGILLLAICMLLFTNPRITGDKKISVKWIAISVAAMLINGGLAVIAKIYALKTDGIYAAQFLVYGYLFATLTSFLIALILRSGQKKEERRSLREFLTPSIVFLFLLAGASNFGMNLIVLLLATLMDGAIVYPAIQGGGPVIAVLCSRFFFGEKISLMKWAAIILGVLAIVMLNL